MLYINFFKVQQSTKTEKSDTKASQFVIINSTNLKIDNAARFIQKYTKNPSIIANIN